MPLVQVLGKTCRGHIRICPFIVPAGYAELGILIRPLVQVLGKTCTKGQISHLSIYCASGTLSLAMRSRLGFARRSYWHDQCQGHGERWLCVSFNALPTTRAALRVLGATTGRVVICVATVDICECALHIIKMTDTSGSTWTEI